MRYGTAHAFAAPGAHTQQPGMCFNLTPRRTWAQGLSFFISHCGSTQQGECRLLVFTREKRQQKYIQPLMGCFKATTLRFYMENTQDRSKEDGKWKVVNSGAGKQKGKKKKLGEGGREQSMNYSSVKSSPSPSAQKARPWIWERLSEIAGSAGLHVMRKSISC